MTRAEIEAILAGCAKVRPGPWTAGDSGWLYASDGKPIADFKHADDETLSHVERLDPQTVASLCTALIESMDRVEELEFGLAAAVQIAGEAAEEWDKAPEGMRAGKILLALAGHRPRYRPDTDAIHAALAARKSLGGSNER